MEQFALKSSDITSFQNDGVVCLRGVLRQNEIEDLRDAVDLQMRNIGASPSAYDFEAIARALWSSDGQPEIGNASRFDVGPMVQALLADPNARPLLEEVDEPSSGAFFYDSAGWHEYEHIRRAAFDSYLPEVVAMLLNSNTLSFWEDTTFVKLPGTRQKTAFHQDHGFSQTDGDQCAIAWIPLDAANLDNGVTKYIRGSHLWEKTFAANLLIAQTPLPGSIDEKCPDIEANESAYDIISFEVEPGDVIIHHSLTLHGAGGNLSNRMRRAISFKYCGDNVRYLNRPGALPQQGVSHQLQDGDRLHSRDYPLVWPKPWPEISLSALYDVEQVSAA